MSADADPVAIRINEAWLQLVLDLAEETGRPWWKVLEQEEAYERGYRQALADRDRDAS